MKKEIYETIISIDKIKKHFEHQIEKELSLTKVECPLFVKSTSGLQDNLSGTEKAVKFKAYDEDFEIVHSLAKWKRLALQRYGFDQDTGLYTDMMAIRKHETIDDIHSLYVEQWDWEKVIKKSDRTEQYLKDTVEKIYKSIRETALYYKKLCPSAEIKLPKTITFITAQELEDLYPDKTSKEREYLYAKEKGAIFIIGIGDKLKSGKPHDLRSPDYDDWSLDGDLIVYDQKYDREIELSSMGIRVDEESLQKQLEKSKCLDRLELDYHKKIIEKKLPYTIGGGIGKTRILLLILGKKHLSEVQASTWPTVVEEELETKKIKYL